MIQKLDPSLFYELLDCAEDGDPALMQDKQRLLPWLYEQDAYLFRTLERLQVLFQEQNAFMNAVCSLIVEMYANFRLARRAFHATGENMVEAVENVAKKKRPPKKKENPNAEEFKQETVKRVRFIEIPEESGGDGYLSREPFSDAYDLAKFLHYVENKRSPKMVVKDLPNIVDLEEVYSCAGPWDAEKLVMSLTQQGKFAIIAKKKGGDEVLGFKVFSGVKKQVSE
jgi:hypothetical protein